VIIRRRQRLFEKNLKSTSRGSKERGGGTMKSQAETVNVTRLIQMTHGLPSPTFFGGKKIALLRGTENLPNATAPDYKTPYSRDGGRNLQ